MFKRVICVVLFGLSLLGRPCEAQNATASSKVPEANPGGSSAEDRMMAQVLQLLSSTAANSTATQLPGKLASEKQASASSSQLPASQKLNPSLPGAGIGGNLQSLLGQLLASSVPSPSPLNAPSPVKASDNTGHLTKATLDANNQEIQALLQQLLAKMSNTKDIATSASDIVPVVAALPVATASASSGLGLGGFEGLVGQIFGVQPLTGMPGIPLGIVSDAAAATALGSGKSASAGMGIDTPFGSISKSATITSTANEDVDVMSKLRMLYAFLEKTILGLGTVSAVIFFFAWLDVAFAEARGGIAKKKEWLVEQTGGAANATEEIAAAVANAINRNF